MRLKKKSKNLKTKKYKRIRGFKQNWKDLIIESTFEIEA